MISFDDGTELNSEIMNKAIAQGVRDNVFTVEGIKGLYEDYGVRRTEELNDEQLKGVYIDVYNMCRSAKYPFNNLFDFDEIDHTSERKRGTMSSNRIRDDFVFSEELSSYFLHVTPEIAEDMMARNTDYSYRNRPIASNTIKRYEKALLENRWRLTGEPIIFSEDGVLLNGQHRLIACINTGESFRTLVVFGISRDAFKFMDRGLKRNVSHVFAIEGIPNATLMAACVSWLDRIHNSNGFNRGAARRPENEQFIDIYDDHKDLQNSAWVSNKISKEGEKLVSPALMTTLHYLFAKKDREEADNFMRKVITGIGITEEKEPENLIRKWLMKDNIQPGKVTNDVYRAAFIVQAWNARRAGKKKMGGFRWRGASKPDEPFPTIY